MNREGPRSPDSLLAEIQEQLVRYREQRDLKSLRELTVLVTEMGDTVRKLGRAVAVAAGLSPTSARARIRGYFERFPQEVIDGIELAAISGISEYARRIRELREEGFPIRTGPDAVNPDSGSTLRADQYLYLPDDQASSPQRR